MATPPVKRNATDRDDSALLRAIALQRDRDAFEALVQRYESFLYNLAVHITGKRELAEETFQEAMLRVWTSAASFRGDGEVKAWLARIVAREAVRTGKSHKAKTAKGDMEMLENVDTPALSPLQSAEHSEMAGALRAEFARLPELDRQVVGLHFAGGLTQQEIGQALSIPQQTVSYRLNDALRHLRSSLSTSGYAVALPLLAKLCGDALLTGNSVPAGLHERVMDRVAAARPSLRQRRAPRNAGSASTVGKLLAATMLVAGAGAIYAFSTEKAPQPIVAAPAPSASVAPPAPVTAVSPPKTEPAKPSDTSGQILPLADWHKRWTFEKGFPDELKHAFGDYKVNPATHTLEIPNEVRFLICYTLPAYPLLFTLKGTVIDGTRDTSAGLTIYKGPHMLIPKMWKKHLSLPDAKVERHYYLYRRTLVGLDNEHIGMLNETPEDIAGGVLVFSLSNFAMQELSATPLKEDEVPEYVKHTEGLKQELPPYVDPHVKQ